MPEYLSPGVYVEEVDAGPKPIEGVSTSTAGAVGVTARGPDEGKPVLVTSFADFQRKFGGAFSVDQGKKDDFSTADEGGEFWNFPLAVKGFFDNGGQRLYVKRVVGKGAKPSDVTLGTGVISVVRSDAPDTATVLQLEHLIGIEANKAYDITIAGNVVNRTVQSYDPAARTITLNLAVGTRVRAGRDYVTVNAGSGANTIKLAAYAKGKWGDGIEVRVGAAVAATLNLVAKDGQKEVRAEIEADSTDLQKFKVKVPPTLGTITDIVAGDTITVGDTDYKTSAAATATGDITVAVPPKWTAGTVVTRVKAVPADPTVDGVISADSSDPAKFKLTVPLTNGAPTDIKANDKVDIGGTQYTVDVDVTATGDVVLRLPPAPVVWKKGTVVVRVRSAAAVNDTKINVWGASALYKKAVVELDDGKKKHLTTVDDVTGNKVTLGAGVPMALFEGSKLRLIEVDVRARYGTAESAVDETFPGLRLHDEASNRAPDYFTTRLRASALIRDITNPVIDITSLADFPRGTGAGMAPGWARLTGGDDDMASINADAFVGTDAGPGKRTGIAALEDIDEISICMVPGIWAPSVHSALITHCEVLKDRFAIIDPPRTTDDTEAIRTFREAIDTKYAALYWPWIAVRDPFTSESVELGPSGHIAGIYARTDVERGVYKAPANEVIRNIDLANGRHGLRLEITKREQDMLNPKGINALRFFPNRGTRVWGARTLSSDGSWKYVNVRRIFIFVEESIDEGTQWVVFEPNDEPTWARVRQSITNFLTTVWRSGALQGAKAEEAFFVRCDRTTMSQDDIDNGRLICVIGIAPVKPAEFVIFRIQQKTLETRPQA